MKRIVKVTIEKEYEIELDPSLLTEEYVKEFEAYMFKLDGDTHEEKLNSLHQYAAEDIARWGEDRHIEAMGYSGWRDASKYFNCEKPHVLYHMLDDYVESEIVE